MPILDRSKKHAGPKGEADRAGTAAPAAVAPRAPVEGAGALIGPSIRIKGEIAGKEDLIIEGHVEGTIALAGKNLTIGQSGNVRANVMASIIYIRGELYGDIHGHEKVVISKTGNVQGNIVSPRVTLEDGAKFRGSIDMDPSGSTGSVKQARPNVVAQPPRPPEGAPKPQAQPQTQQAPSVKSG